MAKYSTPESLAALTVLDTELNQLISNQPPPPATPMSIEEIRVAAAKSLSHVVGNVGRSQVRKIPLRDGYENEIRIYKPNEVEAGKSVPLAVLIYGGSFILGDNKQLNPYARAISALHGAMVISISYRLAPEFKFPYGVHDCWDSLQWITNHAADLGADLSTGFVLGGVSAGANLAAVIAQKTVFEHSNPPLTGLWLGVPFVLDEAIVPEKHSSLFLSRQQNQDAPLLNDEKVREAYGLVGFDVFSPDFSPFNFSRPHIGMPPTYIQVAGADPLRDDGLIYARVLEENGVSTRLSVYPGAPHGHYSAWPSAEISRKWDFDVVSALGWLLGRSANPDLIREALDARNEP